MAARVREARVFESQLIIGGTASPARAGATFDRAGPGNGAVVTRAAAASAREARDAANAAAAAFADWARRKPCERAAWLERAAALLGERRQALAEAAEAEVGAAPSWMDFNVDVSQAILRQAASLCDALGDERRDTGDALSILRRQPAGVVLGIAPWNAPVVLAVRAVAAPLACGNTVVLKGSELCPRTHQLIVETLNEAGLPAGVANFVTNAPDHGEEVVEALIAHPAVRRVNFTGSTRVGERVAALAARHLKKCLLELSGKAPLVVLEDADLDRAADAAVFGAFFNQGQICIATDRVIVLDRVADAFVARLVARAQALGGRADLGSMISADAAWRVRGLIDDAVSKGAALLAGGEIAGAAMRPAVVDHVSSAMRLYREETFGPVASVLRVSDVDEAVSVANDCEYGLAGAVFGRDTDAALAVAGRIETGICHVNGPTVHDDPAMPFGGMKASGYGRFGGRAALDEFTELRWISVHRAAPHPTL